MTRIRIGLSLAFLVVAAGACEKGVPLGGSVAVRDLSAGADPSAGADLSNAGAADLSGEPAPGADLASTDLASASTDLASASASSGDMTLSLR